ncbi:MAG: hypothetical protein RIC55_06675 [Pirellulaceae bacterium]
MAVVGPGAAFEPGKTHSVRNFKDVMSGTILAVLVSEEQAVPWTKPSDLSFDPSDPLATLGGQVPPWGIPVLMADGKIRTLPASTTAEQFQALVTIAGGESTEFLDNVAPVTGEANPHSRLFGFPAIGDHGLSDLSP